MIVYFSATGNSRYCAQALAQMTADEALDAFPFIRDGIAPDVTSHRPYVFVCPTYAWRLPQIFEDFLRSGRFDGCREVYFIMTCGSEIGAPEASIRQLCREKDWELRGVFAVKMPENYLAMFPVPEEDEGRRIVARARPALEQAAERIRCRRDFPARKTGVRDKLCSGLVHGLFYCFAIRTGPFRTTERCNGCGKCEALCPLGNITLREGRPHWGGRCTHCMACICGCPTQAIEYGQKSVGRHRWQCPPWKGEEKPEEP